MKKNHRRLLVAVGALVVLLAAAGAVAIASLPTERIAALAAGRAESALDRDVDVERVALRLFPRPAVVLGGVVIGPARYGTGDDAGGAEAADLEAADPRPNAEPAASVERVELRPRLLPLLRRQVVIDALVLDRPRLLITSDPSDAVDVAALDREWTGDVRFDLRRIEVRGGRLVYRDAESGTVLDLDGLDQRLRVAGEVRQGVLERIQLDGTLEIAAASLDAPGRLPAPIRDVPVRIAHRAAYEADGDRLRLDSMAVRVRDLGLEGSGEVGGLMTPATRELALRLSAGPAEAVELASWLPDAAWQPPSPLATADGGRARLAGRVRIEAEVAGRAGAGEMPAVSGRLDLDGVGFGHPGRVPLLEALTGGLAFSLDSVAGEGLTGRLLGERVRLGLWVHDLADPVGRVSVATLVDLERAHAAGLVAGEADVRGRLPVDLTIAGPLLDPLRWELNGGIGLTGLAVRTDAVASPVTVEAGQLVFEGRDLRSAGLELRLAGSDLTLDLAARDWLPAALGREVAPPRVSVDARSSRFHADSVLGESEPGYGDRLFRRLASGEPAAVRPAAPAGDAGEGIAALRKVDLDARIRADTLVRGELTLRDVDLAVAARDGELELRSGTARLLDGGVRLTGRLAPAVGVEDVGTGRALTVHFDVRDVGAEPFFGRLTPFRQPLSGVLQLAGSLQVLLDDELLPVPESIAGGGTLAISGGRLVNWPMFRELGRRLELAQFDTVAFRDWYGRFTFAGTRIALDETVLETEDVTVRTAGWFDFGGRLDLGATVRLPAAWSAQAGGTVAPRLAAAVAGPDGRVPLGVRVTGSAGAPELALDLSELTTAAAERLRQEAQEQARSLVDRAAGEPLERAREQLEQLLPTPDSPELRLPVRDTLAATADSARARLEAELQRRLRLPRPPNR